MCNVGDDNFEETTSKFMPQIKQRERCDKCNKCRTEKPCIVLRNKDSYCKTCFLSGTIHKFKSLLGKHRLIHPNNKVLVLHKAGHPSTSLLHFLRTGLDLTTPKRLRFNPIFLYIDDQFYLNSNERCDLATRIEEQVKSLNFDTKFVSFNEYVVQKDIRNILYDEAQWLKINGEELVNDILTKKCSTTNKVSIITNIKRQLLLDVATFLGCQFIFTPEIAIDVASNILGNISMGKGQHVSLDTGFCDPRDSSIMILRPLRQFEMKELSMYNFYSGIEPVHVREYELDPYSSVQNLLQKFIKDLQVSYPATVTTIVKTGDKLAFDQTSVLGVSCKFCKVPLHKVASTELTSEESTKFSHWVSTQVRDSQTSPELSEDNFKFSQDSSYDDYCYSCKKLVNCIKINDN